jgi:hypothetical protein
LSSGWYYGAGIFFSIAAALLLLRNLRDLITGRIAAADLIQVQESEDALQARQWNADGPAAASSRPGKE